MAIAGYDKEKGEYQYVDFGLILNQPLRTDVGETAGNLAVAGAGPFINSGGPLESAQSIIRGSDMYGRPLNQPYGQTSVDVAAQAVVPFYPIVAGAGDILNSIRGVPSSEAGRVRPVTDSILRLMGINVTRGSTDQLQKNLDAIVMQLNDRQSIYKKVIANPDVSPQIAKQAAKRYQNDVVAAYQEIADLLNKNGASPDKTPNLTPFLDSIFKSLPTNQTIAPTPGTLKNPSSLTNKPSIIPEGVLRTVKVKRPTLAVTKPTTKRIKLAVTNPAVPQPFILPHLTPPPLKSSKRSPIRISRRSR